eukprot:10704064-Alexandrium_andersonii.AAC.1
MGRPSPTFARAPSRRFQCSGMRICTPASMHASACSGVKWVRSHMGLFATYPMRGAANSCPRRTEQAGRRTWGAAWPCA